MTQAQQIAGYLKLTKAHFHALTRDGGMIMNARQAIVSEMDPETKRIAWDLVELMGLRETL